MKISERTRKDFEFFRDTELDTIGSIVGVQISGNTSGKSALECWFLLDTHGKNAPCREPEVLSKAMRGKQSWNLQIKMWAESLAEGTLFQWELVDYCHGLPTWIFDATMNQSRKILKGMTAPDGKPFGDYVPTFMQTLRIFGQWIPPWMLSFDPLI